MYNRFGSGLREYETYEQIFKRCTNAYYQSHESQLRDAYALLSEGAENGDPEAVYYFARWYSTFPEKYGKKRNRILSTGKSVMCLKELAEAYQNGYYCKKDERKANEYMMQAADLDSDVRKELIFSLYEKGERENSRKLAIKYMKEHPNLDIYHDMHEALIYVFAMLQQIIDENMNYDVEDVKRKVHGIFDVKWSYEIKDENGNPLRDRLLVLAAYLLSRAYQGKGMYVEAINAVWIVRNLQLIAMITKDLLNKVPDAVAEKNTIRVWKEINEGGYDQKHLELAKKKVKEMLEEYKKKGTLSYARLTKIAQEEGCWNADIYEADVQELIRDESMLNQALEILQTSNYRSAIQELIRLSEKGSAEANYHLGLAYYEGTKIEHDMDKAKRCMKKAVDLGFSKAQEVAKEWKI